MGGNTGNIRGSRNQSSSNGSKTLGSILASDGSNGAGSTRRIYGAFIKNGNTVSSFYETIFNLKYGQFKDRSNLFLGRA